ncbi:hypothetical protein COS52_04040, partial [Candidatus Roizmanbacteria bacterium CG03_land_8_20_14_0_80_39_12]
KERKFSFCQYQKSNSKYQKKHLLLFHLVNYPPQRKLDKLYRYAIMKAYQNSICPQTIDKQNIDKQIGFW